jgi:hypothetical protein
VIDPEEVTEYLPAEVDAEGWSLLEVVVGSSADALSDGTKDRVGVASVVEERSLLEDDDGVGVAVEDGRREEVNIVDVGSSGLLEGLSSCRRAKRGAAATVCRQRMSASPRSRTR